MRSMGAVLSAGFCPKKLNTKTQRDNKNISKKISPLFSIFSERFWSKPSHFNVSIGACAIAFAAEMTLFLISAHFAIRAKADAHVRLENEEVDALLQGMKRRFKK